MKPIYLLIGVLLLVGSASAISWLNTSFPYRDEYILTNPNPNYSDFVANFTFDSLTPINDGKMQSNCNDVRFSYINSSGGEQRISYYLYQDDGVYGSVNGRCAGGNANASVYLRFPSLVSTTTVRVYFGNTTAESQSNPNTTLNFFDFPLNTLNTSKWDNYSYGGLTIPIINREIRLQGSVTNWAKVSIKDYLNGGSGAIQNKTLIFMGRMVNFGLGYAIVETNLTTGWGYFLTDIGSSSIPIRIDYNSSGTFSKNIATNSELSANGLPKTNQSLNMSIASGNTNLEDFRFTNITVIGWPKLPFNFAYNGQTKLAYLNFSALDSDNGRNIYFNYSVSNATSTFVNHSFGLNDFNLTSIYPLGSITVMISNSSYYSNTTTAINDLTSQSFSLYLTPKISNNFTLYAYDADTSLPIYFNVTITNSSYTFNSITNNTYRNSTSIIPYGTLNIVFQNSSYYPTTVISSNDYTKKSVIAYLTTISGSTIRDSFHIQSFAGVQIAGATVTVQKLIGSSYVTISQCITDSSGTCSIYLDASITYKVIITADGYTSLTQFINPASDHTIILQGGSNPTYQPDLKGIYIFMSPDTLNRSNNWTIINFTIRDELGGLSGWGLNITYGGIQTGNASSTNPNGGSVLVNVTSDGRTNNITAIGYWKKASGASQVFIKVYYINSRIVNKAWSLTSIRDSVRSGGGGNTIVFVALMFSMVTVAYVTRYMPVVIGGGVIAVVALYVFLPFAVGSAYSGFIFGFFLVVLGIIAIALALIKGRV